MKKIFQRIYSDFFLNSRLEEYKSLIIKALENEYKVISIEQFNEIFMINEDKQNSKYLVLRHDIDTDVSTAKLMFEIENSYKFILLIILGYPQ